MCVDRALSSAANINLATNVSEASGVAVGAVTSCLETNPALERFYNTTARQDDRARWRLLGTRVRFKVSNGAVRLQIRRQIDRCHAASLLTTVLSSCTASARCPLAPCTHHAVLAYCLQSTVVVHSRQGDYMLCNVAVTEAPELGAYTEL